MCDTFLPAFVEADDPAGFFATGAPAAATAERAARMIAAIPDPRDRRRMGAVLAALDSPLVNLLVSGRPRSFASLDPAARAAVLLGWSRSRIALLRAGFQALKRVAHVAYYCWPVRGGTHPAWNHVGYPGPLPLPATGPAPLPALRIDRESVLDCDVVVVGSGAGGGVVAGLLAEAGRAVVVVEKGPNPGYRDFTHVEGDALETLYLDRAVVMTQDGSLPILAGSCVGGGTVINYTASFPLPPPVRAQWDRLAGLKLFESARFQESLDRVAARLDVGTRWSTPGARDRLLETGCRALGWHVGIIPRNVTACREGRECGYCGYGCRHGAKNSTARTYLAAAVAAGARLVARCDVRRVLVDGGRAVGVEGIAAGADGRRHRLTVRARAVVAACGAVHTPALLARSGITNPSIGRGLRLHPATAVLGRFAERVEPWSGALQTRYSDQLADQRDGYGVKLETVPVHFALAASGLGWDGARNHRDDVGRLAHTSLVGVLLRDRDPGRVAVGRDGRPRVQYALSAFDAAHARRGLVGAAEVLAAAGATDLLTLHTPPIRLRPGAPGWRAAFTRAMDAIGYRPGRLSYITFHQMASCAMGRERARSVVGETGQSHDVRALFVADASTFPTSSGVNPMITIMAIADHVGRAIVDAL